MANLLVLIFLLLVPMSIQWQTIVFHTSEVTLSNVEKKKTFQYHCYFWMKYLKCNFWKGFSNLLENIIFSIKLYIHQSGPAKLGIPKFESRTLKIVENAKKNGVRYLEVKSLINCHFSIHFWKSQRYQGNFQQQQKNFEK